MTSHGLVADIGGTNIRFALVGENARELLSLKRVSTKDHADLAAAARAYLAEAMPDSAPNGLVFAVAGPVDRGEVALTNAGWHISARALKDDLGVGFACVVNDFEALAEAVPELRSADLVPVGTTPPFDATAAGTVALVGPGTGLGVGGLVRHAQTSLPLVTEGGHVAFAPADETEIEILRILMKKFGRVSAERILSGPGLVNLHAAMSEIEGRALRDVAPEEITKAAHTAPESFEGAVFMRFAGILGAFAGDVALTMGAKQGVLIGGGILPEIRDAFVASPFRARFEDKARFAAYMKAIPTALIVEEHAGLIGAAAILRRHLAEKS